MSDDDLIRRGDAIAEIRKQIGEDDECAWTRGNNSAIASCSAILRSIPAVQVAVKPLEWVNRPDRDDYVSDRYVVQVFFGSDQYYFEAWDLSVGVKIYDGDDLAAAKAAAQADYDARIRSALPQ